MRNTIALTALAAVMALAATDASASCQGRKNTGTAIGAIGGALLGNSISKGGGGAVIGGLGGAVAGHQIAKGGCGASRHAYYRHGHNRYASNYAPARKVYYDQRGNPVTTTDDYRR